MNKPDEALEIIKSLGLPQEQQNLRSCLTLLALAGLREADSWSSARRPRLRTVDIMDWMRKHYGKDYKPNTRETIRRQTIHQFEQARLIDRNPDDPARPTNSGRTVYQLTHEAAQVLRNFGTRNFSQKCARFIQRHGSLSAAFARTRNMAKIPLMLPNGKKVQLSPGLHNELQRLIVEEFGPRFAAGSTVLYLGDTADKRLVIASEELRRLNVPEMNHDKLPDVVLHDKLRNWLFLIEAVTTHGPISPKRQAELEDALTDCPAGRVYVTAFLDFKTFSKYVSQIVWESEVWIAASPDHLIHFDGKRFLGPYPLTTAEDAES